MKLKNAERLTQEQIDQAVEQWAASEGKISNAAVIRTLFAGGLEVKEISTCTGILYQQCYNNIKNEVLVHGLEVEKTSREGGGKKDIILGLLNEGKSLTEVAAETRSLYNAVWKIAKDNNLTNKQKNEVKEEVVVPEPANTKKMKRA